MAIPLETRMTYWRSLLVRVVPSHVDEVRIALRDALHEIEDLRSQVERERQRYAWLEANSRPVSPLKWSGTC